MMTRNELNLASRPFVNRRPRRRVAILLWSVAALLFCWNAFLFVQYWLGSSSGREQLRQVRSQVDERIEVMETLESRLVQADLDDQNAQVRFLNRKIAERAFPWSRLFDHMVEVMPRNVRLVQLAPAIPEEKVRGPSRQTSSDIDWIDLRIRATAKRSDDVLDLLDTLFEHPYFARPLLAQERTIETGVEFGVSVRYLVGEPPTSESVPGLENSETEDGNVGLDGALVTDIAGSDGSSGVAAAPGQAGGGPDDRTAASSWQRSADQSSPRTAWGTAASEPQAQTTREQGQHADGSRARPGTPGAVTRDAESQSPEAAQRDIAGELRSVGSTEEVADERFGRNQAIAPRLANASGSGNGGSR
jgi:hypothetical protein